MNSQELISAKYVTTDLSRVSDVPVLSCGEIPHDADSGWERSSSLKSLLGPVFLMVMVCGLGYIGVSSMQSVSVEVTAKLEQAKEAQQRAAAAHNRAIDEMSYNSQQDLKMFQESINQRNQDMIRSLRR